LPTVFGGFFNDLEGLRTVFGGFFNDLEGLRTVFGGFLGFEEIVSDYFLLFIIKRE
jgi:hypothetical protein